MGTLVRTSKLLMLDNSFRISGIKILVETFKEIQKHIQGRNSMEYLRFRLECVKIVTSCHGASFRISRSNKPNVLFDPILFRSTFSCTGIPNRRGLSSEMSVPVLFAQRVNNPNRFKITLKTDSRRFKCKRWTSNQLQRCYPDLDHREAFRLLKQMYREQRFENGLLDLPLSILALSLMQSSKTKEANFEKQVKDTVRAWYGQLVCETKTSRREYR